MDGGEHGEKLKAVLRLEAEVADLREKLASQRNLREIEVKNVEERVQNMKQEQISQATDLRQEVAAQKQVVQALSEKTKTETEMLRSQYEEEVKELNQQNKLNRKRQNLDTECKRLEAQTTELERVWDHLKEQSAEIGEGEKFLARRHEILVHKKEELEQQEEDLERRRDEVVKALQVRPAGGGITEVLKPKTDEILKLKEQLLTAQLQRQNKEQQILHLQHQLLEAEKENEEFEALHSHFQVHLELALSQIQHCRDAGSHRQSRRRSQKGRSVAKSEGEILHADAAATGGRRLRRQTTREQLRNATVQAQDGDELPVEHDHDKRRQRNVVHSSKTCLIM